MASIAPVVTSEPQQGRRAVEQLSCGIDGHRDVVTNVSRVGIWRVTWSAREVVRFAANEPRAWREEAPREARWRRHRQGPASGGHKPPRVPRRKTVVVQRGRSRLLPPLAPGFGRGMRGEMRSQRALGYQHAGLDRAPLTRELARRVLHEQHLFRLIQPLQDRVHSGQAVRVFVRSKPMDSRRSRTSIGVIARPAFFRTTRQASVSPH